MTRRTVALGLGALIVVSATFVGVQTAHAGEPCTVTNPSIDAAGTHATFDVQGHCTVTLVSYELHGKGTLGEQTLFDSTTEEFSCAPTATSSSDGAVASSAESQGRSSTGSCSSTADLTVTVPDCRYQTDLVLGQPRNPPTGYKPGEVLTWRYGGEGECLTPSTTTTKPQTTTTTIASITTTMAAVTTSITTPTVLGTTDTPESTPALASNANPPSTPTELPHTGGGELLPVALGALGLIGAGRFSLWRAKRRRTG